MRQFFNVASIVIAVLLGSGFRQSGNALEGAWDLTIQAGGATYPSWIEISGGANPAVRVVSRTGSVHPASEVKVEGNHLTFSEGGKTKWDVTASQEHLTGTQMTADTSGQVNGIPAPALNRAEPKAWSEPEALFNGKDLTGWTPSNPAKNHWTVEGGALVNAAPGANLQTDRKFKDFKLHIEYNCPREGNSGVYLRGRYETQVEYEEADRNNKLHGMGSIYGFLAPVADVVPRPGEWESYDITLVGRTVTVIRDGVKTIDAQRIPGITGGALDSHEGEPGPFYLQGDHTGGMKYRNITVSVPRT